MKVRIKINKTSYGMWWVRSHPNPPSSYLLYVVVDTWTQAMSIADLAARDAYRFPRTEARHCYGLGRIEVPK